LLLILTPPYRILHLQHTFYSFQNAFGQDLKVLELKEMFQMALLKYLRQKEV